MNKPFRLAFIRVLILILMTTVGCARGGARPAHQEASMSAKPESPSPSTSGPTSAPNRSLIVEGLGRLPQFSHATVAGDLIFVSGTLGTQGEGFDLVPGGTGPETTQTLRNIEKILRAAGADLSDIVKVSVFLVDMTTFKEMNNAYAEFFGPEPPARITVGGIKLALGAAVEIECIARVAN
jgi:2-iminobutanoate/2-iminopropanoate deaminase